jgi:hypothetical protein
MAAAALRMSKGEEEAAEVQIEQPQRPGEWTRARRERTAAPEERGGGIEEFRMKAGKSVVQVGEAEEQRDGEERKRKEPKERVGNFERPVRLSECSQARRAKL